MSDTKFIDNRTEGETLLDRFKILVKDSQTFDCLVGYFYASGFATLAKSLETTEHIRVLIGLSTDKMTYDFIQEAKTANGTEITNYSRREVRDAYSRNVRCEMDNSADSYDVEQGIRCFIDWIQSGKLEVRAYRADKIHAKLYIMKFKEGDKDFGRVITGSSNFSKSGLAANLEFNVELKDRADYDYAQERFNELWGDAVDVSEEYVKTIEKQTWLSSTITPYQLYLKFLYEYLKEQINLDKEKHDIALPDGYMELQYQKDAVSQAISILDEYDGVFISDVVGLGKTYITSLLLKTLNNMRGYTRALVLAPPVLVDRKNPGSWPRVLDDFGVPGCYCESIGKLDQIAKNVDLDHYNYVVIDEAHKFRNERTQMYDDLYKLCVGKKVILVTATPLNNSADDILSQIKLFQPAHASTLPNPKTKDLEAYFSDLKKPLIGLDRQKNKDKYLKKVKEISETIRKDILQYLMIRRTRTSIVNFYKEDMERQGLKFPEVADPQPLFYRFNEKLNTIFDRSIELIVKEYKYARYAPLLFLKVKDEQILVGQKNMMKFMKILLLKRLESSFQAFRMTVSRMITSYERFIDVFQNEGVVYTGDNTVKNLMKLIEEDNYEKIEQLMDEGRVQKHMAAEFEDDFIDKLNSDLEVLKKLRDDWETVTSDPKLERFIAAMEEDKHLHDQKVLVFTESKETADYITENLKKEFGDCVLNVNGSSDPHVRQVVIENFDGKVKEDDRADDYRILVTTEVLAEGVNLHRSNVVVNYDIPWNPVRMIQRVGRINRVDTKFEKIYTYNFFPTAAINDELKLKELAEAKIEAFIEMLGNDAKLLTDEEIKSHDLFKKLNSRSTITGEDDEDDPELKFLAEIRKIRDEQPELFDEIKNLPKKARVIRSSDKEKGLVTFFRKGKLRKIFVYNGEGLKELDFVEAAKTLEAAPEEKGDKVVPKEFYDYLERNKAEFDNLFALEQMGSSSLKGNEVKLRSMISSLRSRTTEFTDLELKYISDVENALTVGTVPKFTVSMMYKEIKTSGLQNSPSIYREIYNILRKNVDSSMVMRGKLAMAEPADVTQVILSEYYGV